MSVSTATMDEQVKNKKDRPSRFQSIAYLAPLFAAVFAPFSTLLDIPALTQPWYEKDGQVLADFKASLVLSALGLSFNIVANALL